MSNAPRADLPLPARTRWQPLRLGLVELFHYDSEEFWFRDGHLLLRGNNGTGKSKVLSLTLPFLFDAQLKPSRIEPDGDAGKKMAWNLLLGRHERRMGYAWVEFGRIDEDGEARYLTLGCGLSAAAARPEVASWYFTLDDERIGRDLWLTQASGPVRAAPDVDGGDPAPRASPGQVVLTRERLREALQGRVAQLFDSATAYRRAVDERLFRLGTARYAALMDTLIQLRQPQLSKKPDEGNLSDALTEALPPMAPDLLADVAEALNQLEEDRRQLEEYEALARAVGQFIARYRLYAATQARRQARGLRSAQTGFDAASRVLNEDRAALEKARAAEAAASVAQAESDAALAASRVRQDELRNDPATTSALQLDQAERDATRRRQEAAAARDARRQAEARAEREQQAGRTSEQQAARAAAALTDVRSGALDSAASAGLESACAVSPLTGAAPADLVAFEPLALETARRDLRSATAARADQVALLLRRCEEVDRAVVVRDREQAQRDDCQDEAVAAAARRDAADATVEACGQALLDAWRGHLDGLRQLRLDDEPDALLQDLARWVAGLQGDNPARGALHAAQQAASQRHAQREAALDAAARALGDEEAQLQDERTRLQAGEDKAPPAPHWRSDDARIERPGAPFWQLVEFQAGVGDVDRAGLEAALEAAGLLDAWVTPDGRVRTDTEAAPRLDAQWLERPRQPRSLAAWLAGAADVTAAVPPAVVQRLLEGVACTPDDDDPAVEAWVSPTGRFRLGALGGAWQKSGAGFIGHVARASARARRLREVEQRLNELSEALAAVRDALAQVARDREQAAAEWRLAPADDALRAAHLEAAAQARACAAARQRLEQADARLQLAVAALESARQGRAGDAVDLQLPTERPALQAVDRAVRDFGDALHALANGVREFRDAQLEHSRQQQRSAEAESDARHAAERSAECDEFAAEARVRFETLRESVGTAVEELQRRLTQARDAVALGEATAKACAQALREAGEQRARADQKCQDAEATLGERTTARQHAVARLQGFAATGLLATALPDAEIPPLQAPWTIEPALALARRTEQSLVDVKDDDDAWTRVQNQISQDYTELGRALTALGQQAQAETSDHGLVVRIVYRNRPERPDRLGQQLEAEIVQRRELLTAGEREVLENHLQAEIASAVQKLLRDAERQVRGINAELDKRPTSTGVKFRLLWQALPEGAEGAPVGLEAARRRLLNTSTDLWTAEDRRVVGQMLQQRITAERSRADRDQGGSLLEQLARALDYRRWHRFRVQRWQDGQWRPLSGPASSGERALGLTVPLFAAVSSYYTQEGYAHAPRLVLLDEAFAGIDDAARAHCMALVREFDLDFVITSEREWACYAELPGVAIAQLQRREGIDAVHVSRWTWDGRARRQEADPDRRFPSSDRDAE